MKSFFALLLALMSFPATAEPASTPVAHFEKLKTLVGEWKKEGSGGKDFHISFEGSANGSVIIENWIHKGASHSLTIYHLDGNNVLATHYCPQGNQPRLKLERPDKENVLSFAFQDATNLESPQASHQHSLTFEFMDENTVSRRETYMKAGTITPSSLKLVRR